MLDAVGPCFLALYHGVRQCQAEVCALFTLLKVHLCFKLLPLVVDNGKSPVLLHGHLGVRAPAISLTENLESKRIAGELSSDAQGITLAEQLQSHAIDLQHSRGWWLPGRSVGDGGRFQDWDSQVAGKRL